MRQSISALQQHRYQYQPASPSLLQSRMEDLVCQPADWEESGRDEQTLAAIQRLFPYSAGFEAVQFIEAESPEQHPLASHGGNFAVILSGGQAPGGHNVIAGLFDAIQLHQPGAKLLGFLGGPAGLIDNRYCVLTAELIESYRNTGGFDIIGSGRTKLESEAQFFKVEQVCRGHNIKTVVVIGGDDSNTNAALLAEYFLARNAGIGVIGCPKTIDGDLKSRAIEVSFGFDSATKTYSELIGNIARDAVSARKYWHFIRLMGRSASHITLECALRCQPDVTLISEEVREQRISLAQVVEGIVEVVVNRARQGKNYGVVLVPEGLIEFLPGFTNLIQQLNDLLAHQGAEVAQLLQRGDYHTVADRLSSEARQLFLTLPAMIQRQLLADRDPHGNVQVSLIETEKILVELVAQKIAQLEGVRFSPLTHFFGYEGRACFPSNFDTNYCYALGKTAYLLGASGHTGYIACVRNLNQAVGQWQCGGVPVTALLTIERRHGKDKPVICKALVDLQGPAFRRLRSPAVEATGEDRYLYPGPMQFYGPSDLVDCGPMTLALEQQMQPLSERA